MVKNEIKVFARLKPEAKKKNIVNYQIHRRPKKHLEEDYLVLNGAQKSINEYINNRPESWNFAFYKIFDHDIEQNEVFENVAQPVVQSVLNGYNATIFAYGQTGSGKTFSITGDPERYEYRGVLPRTIQYFFETIQKNPDNLYSVEIAYLEIYNENGYDLLDPKHEVVTKLEDLPRVTIQEDETGTLHLKNLTFRRVENEKDALALLFLGDANRAISETPMNPQSSRSHCIFTIAVSVKQSGAQHLTKAKMHLVDLAGSERVYKCCISGTILTEAKHINLSLHYLEQVIVCLGQQNVSHIPYRNSLLTAILRDSLGGNCLTTMLATLSLNTSNFEETISTCRFSQRVALIKNDVNLVFERNPEDENRFLKMEVERLRNQIAQLTNRPTINGELTTNEKQDLNFQISKFLESNATIDLENDDRKIKYCLQVLRENLRNRNDEKYCVGEPQKDLNYYRNLVVQRDKEISALINMLNKSGRNLSKNSADDPACENHNETSPKISLIAKKVRLRDLMVEARSIAELIKNGKASLEEKIFYSLFRRSSRSYLNILKQRYALRGSRLVAGDLRRRMANVNPLETQSLNEILQAEQLRLAHNLSLLKTLKSEAKELKNDLNQQNHESKNVLTNLSTCHKVTKTSSTPSTESDSKNFTANDDDYRKKYFVPNQVVVSLEPQENRVHEKMSEIMSSTEKKIKSPSKGKFEIISASLKKDSNHELNGSEEILSPGNEITDAEVERITSRPVKSEAKSLVKLNLQKPWNDNDSRRSLTSERFHETKTLPNGESRRSSFRAPPFLRDIMRSDVNSDVGFESPPLETSGKLILRDIETDTLAKRAEISIPSDSSRSEANVSVVNVPKSIIGSPKCDAANVTKFPKISNEIDYCEFKSDRPSSEYEMMNSDLADRFHEASITTEKHVEKEEEPEESDSKVRQPIFIPDGNRESNTTTEGDSNEVMSEDDSFMKSLPLTGDPEIDEEIIAFYRAKRSGGTY